MMSPALESTLESRVKTSPRNISAFFSKLETGLVVSVGATADLVYPTLDTDF